MIIRNAIPEHIEIQRHYWVEQWHEYKCFVDEAMQLVKTLRTGAETYPDNERLRRSLASAQKSLTGLMNYWKKIQANALAAGATQDDF
jgi:hypothetical protein